MKERGLRFFLLVGLLLVLRQVSPGGTRDAYAWRGFFGNGKALSLFVTPETPPRIYAHMELPTWAGEVQRGLFTSTDGGRTWSLVETSVLSSEGSRLLAIDYQNPRRLYALARAADGYQDRFRLMRSDDGGVTWMAAGPWREGPEGDITALAVDFQNPNILYAGRRYLCYGTCGEFIRSTDGGQTWSYFDASRPQGLPRNGIRGILVDPTDAEVLYAETTWSYRGLNVTLLRGDREGHWEEIPGPPLGFAGGLAIDPSTKTLYTGSTRPGALLPLQEIQYLWKISLPTRSELEDMAWVQVASFDVGSWLWFSDVDSIRPLAVDARSGLLYVQTHSADTMLFCSPDGGKTWQQVLLPTASDMPGVDPRYAWTSSHTGHTVTGLWLKFLREHGDTDNLGYPRTGVIRDPMQQGDMSVQYFQRGVLEWHPENPHQYRIQRRLLGDILYPESDPPLPANEHPPGPYHYFPFSPNTPTGLGHFVADYTRTGQPIYFKQYFDSHGGVDAFGYPKEEPKLRDGLWTQRFQAAVFEYHPEYDRDGYLPGTTIPLRNYRVLLRLLGDEYIQLNHLPYR